MREVEIVNGKFTLEGEVVEADILRLANLFTNNLPFHVFHDDNLDKFREYSKEKSFSPALRKQLKSVIKDAEEAKRLELDLINEQKPEEANAYVKGAYSITNVDLKDSYKNSCILSVLYLKLNNCGN